MTKNVWRHSGFLYCGFIDDLIFKFHQSKLVFGALLLNFNAERVYTLHSILRLLLLSGPLPLRCFVK